MVFVRSHYAVALMAIMASGCKSGLPVHDAQVVQKVAPKETPKSNPDSVVSISTYDACKDGT